MISVSDCIKLNVTACKNEGCFNPDKVTRAKIDFVSGYVYVCNGTLTTDIANKICTLQYSCNGGAMVEQTISLMWRESNLPNTQGFYLFVCPVTGKPVRNLYFVGGRFISRNAFKAIYEKQRLSKKQRKDSVFCLFHDLLYLDDERRKYTYRGEPTPFARKVEKINERLRGAVDEMEQERARKY